MNHPRARFFVPDAGGPGRTAHIGGPELRHLRARRVREGDSVIVFDAAGREYLGVVSRVGEDFAEVELQFLGAGLREPPVHFVLCVAAARAQRLDFAVEKATELGAGEVIVFVSERTVRLPSRGRRERWQRVATSAAKQSGRAKVPRVAGPLAFPDLLERLRQAEARSFLFHPGSPPFRAAAAEAGDPGRPIALIVGPEGGFTAAEIERAVAAGCEVVGLGPRLLRTETAAVAVLAIAGFLWGDLAQGPAQGR